MEKLRLRKLNTMLQITHELRFKPRLIVNLRMVLKMSIVFPFSR